MNYTITFNPAIDTVIHSDKIQLGRLNRVETQEFVAGGKGINVSVLLKEFGQESIATGFVGGFFGEFIKKEMKNKGITPHFIEVEENTRINIKIKSTDETEINGPGPLVSKENVETFLQYLKDNVTKEDTVFLCGNTAQGVDSQIYVQIAQLCKKIGAKLILDTNTMLLTECLPEKPFLIKPNEHELEEIFNVNISTIDTIIKYAKELQKLGAENVLVSRGKAGAVLVTNTSKIYTSNIPKGTVVNSVGAGDSMLAGFMAKYIETENFVQSLKQGAASGSATAFSVGIARADQIMKLIDQINIEDITGEMKGEE